MLRASIYSFRSPIASDNRDDEKGTKDESESMLKSDIALPGLVGCSHKELVKIVSLFRIHKKLLRLSREEKDGKKPGKGKQPEHCAALLLVLG